MEWSVVGHEKQRAHLEHLVDAGRLSHAYLFTGPEGIGKRMMATDLMAALVPEGYQFDRLVLAPARDEDGKMHDIPVEAVRDMKAWMALRPMGPHKVVIVDDADLLGTDAANTFLKMLEEPPAYAHFFLITSRPGAILPTITSRCQSLEFRPLEATEMKQAMKGAKLDEDDLALLASVAAGRPGAALRLVADKRVSRVAKSIAGLERSLKDGLAQRLVYAKELADGDDTPEVVGWWLAWAQTQLQTRPQLASVAAGLLDLHDAVSEASFNRRLALDRFFLSW